MGESQGCPSVEVHMKRFRNSKFQKISNENQANKKGQNPGCHKPPPLRMNLILKIRLLGKIILDNVPLEILLIPMLIQTLCDASIGLCKISLLYCE